MKLLSNYTKFISFDLTKLHNRVLQPDYNNSIFNEMSSILLIRLLDMSTLVSNQIWTLQQFIWDQIKD